MLACGCARSRPRCRSLQMLWPRAVPICITTRRVGRNNTVWKLAHRAPRAPNTFAQVTAHATACLYDASTCDRFNHASYIIGPKKHTAISYAKGT